MHQVKDIAGRRTGGRSRRACGGLLLASLLGVGLMPVFADEPPAKDLRLFYKENCAGCHGADGTARNAEGKKLKGQDLTDAAFRKDTQDAAMVKVILKGLFFGLAMPGFKKQLTSEEAQKMVVEIIRTCEKGKVIEPVAKAPAAAAPEAKN